MDKQLAKCIEKMALIFKYNSIVLLDSVFSDDVNDPVFSANFAYHQLEKVKNFQQLYFGDTCQTVQELMLQVGYTADDFADLKRRCSMENRRHGYIDESAEYL